MMTSNDSRLICDSKFWDNQAFWWTTTPRLTDCFRQTVLLAVAPLVLILLTPFDFRYICSKMTTQSIPWRARNVCAAILNLILISISFWHMIRSVWKDVDFWSTVFEPFIDFIGLSLAYILLIIYRRYGRRISIALEMFWLTTSIVSIIRVYLEYILDDQHIIHSRHHISSLIIYCVYISVAIILFLLSLVTDEPSDTHPILLTTGNHNIPHYCPLENESFVSRITFLWIGALLRRGFKSKIGFKDLFRICHSIKAKYITKEFVKYDYEYNRRFISTESRVYRKPIRILPVLWTLSYKRIIFASLLIIIYIPALYGQPYMMNKILDFLNNPNELLWHGIVFSVIYAALISISLASQLHIASIIENVAIRCKSALISAVYRKIFRLSYASRGKYTSGEIINLMAGDCQQVFEFIKFSMNLLIIPLNVGIGFYFLWQYLAMASLGLVAVMLIVIPINVLLGHKLNVIQKKHMTIKDKRLSQINQIINTIKVIKLNAWEEFFISKVVRLRDEELSAQKQMAIIYAFIVLLWLMSPVLTAGACFMVYAITEYSHFDTKRIFVSLAIMNILQNPMNNIPSLITKLIAAIVSLKRLSKFLSAEELNEKSVIRNKKDNTSSINIQNATFSYGLNHIPVLNDLTFDVKKGLLVAIIGEVGAGKSSLLSSLVGVLYKISGNIKVNGSIAYVPQRAWIRNTSIKNNILFTCDEEEIRYQEILSACALTPDLTVLPAGDQTVVGEGGVTLSGGQRQRVSLARAVYQNSDIYLLDDPLSAVDAQVGHQLFHEVISSKGLLRHKTRLLCTHNLTYLSNCDQIIVLRDGEIVGQGNYTELSTLGLLSQISSLKEEKLNEKPTKGKSKKQSKKFQKKQRNVTKYNNEEQAIETMSSRNDLVDTEAEDNNHREDSKPDIKSDEEAVYFGAVLWKDYFTYIASLGFVLFFMIILFRFGSNGSNFTNKYWLSIWTNNTKNADYRDHKFNFIIYGSLLAFEGVFILLGNIVLFVATIKASRKLHLKAFYGIMRSPLAFFDRTPMGRLMNRFSRDIRCIDQIIPDLIISYIDAITLFIISYGLIVYTNMYLAIGLLAVIVLFYMIYRFYVQTSRQMKRLEAISNSPLQNHFCETISGTDSIRAYDVIRVFVNELNKAVDLCLNCYYHIISLNYWLKIWCTIFGSIYTMIISIFIVWFRHDIPLSLAALLLVYSVSSIGDTAYIIKVMADLETNMISVERLRELCQLIPEKSWTALIHERSPPKDWPRNGCIEFKRFSTAYGSDNRPVLKDITCRINAGEKVAIIGRTGAGKTSLALSLFRIIEPICGQILIDGIDITRIGLQKLRSRLAIIPQESILFADTLRKNLDPLSLYSDTRLWAILDVINLTEFVDTLPDKLNFEVTEKGDNLSAGQRQLICLARALLRKPKILVMDEAMSCCDIETDQLIRKVIWEQLADSTVVSIVHRLNTITDFDKVLVFDFGSLITCDSPNNLLLNTDSIFHSIAKETQII
ncbi:multidrug resistance-associated protein 1-like [Oppia nitens]|uniref:multidrug resistance-associated protein 1-like n=1 Tax=Oppia nitens TaxID=1686743 RepID=UPI0023DA4F1A|nr:multidrug resistance-associated protein 1-like [Oppia nitens]